MIKDIKSRIPGSDDKNAFPIIIARAAKLRRMDDLAFETFKASPGRYDWFAVSARRDDNVPGYDRPFVRRKLINSVADRYVIDLHPKFDWHRFFGNEVFKVGDHCIALWKRRRPYWISHARQVRKIPVSIERELRMPRTPLITNSARPLEYPWEYSNLPQFESGNQTGRTGAHDYGGFSLTCWYHDISS
jgi:hypothetical protein